MNRTLMQRSPGAAFLLAICLAAPLCAQNTTDPDSGFDEVEVDLEGQLFNETLPFDVPFLLHGAVPAGAKTLEVRCWKLDSSGKDRKSGEPVILSAEDLARMPDGNCWKGGPLVWQNTIDPAAQNPTFRVLAPRLDAESYYTFEFRYQKQITDAEAQAFAQEVEDTVDRIVWGDLAANPQISSPEQLPLSGPLFEPEIKAIYDELRAALKTITGSDRIVEPGTIFSEGTDFSAVVNEFNARLRPIREDQGKIVNGIGDYRDRVANANSLLAQLRGDPNLIKLQQVFATADPSVQHYAQTISDALAVPNLPVLAQDDRKDQAALAAFVSTSLPAVTDADQKLMALSDLLSNKMFGSDGSPAAFLKPLVDSGALTASDLEALRSLGNPRSVPGTVARTVDGAASVLQGLQNVLSERTAAVAAVAEQYRTEVVGRTTIAGSTTGSFATQHKNYVSADTGLAYAPEIDEFPTYAGTNIYFRPVNKAAPLNQFGGFFDTLSRRVSVTIGLTAQGVGDDGKTRKDLFNQQSLVLGIGARMTNSVRMTLGGLVFLETDPNPLVDDDSVAVTPFLSISFDIDVVPTLQGIGGLFKTGT
ncbi:MAG TPA: hypothetical protein VN493_02720 [Thermoanaerobaculia bacterium]|nr:hypothetical protein [Thermoanaerobaculia bacterium]